MAEPQRFVESIDGHLFVGANLAPYRFVGTNVYWLMKRAAQGEWGRMKVDAVLAEVRAAWFK